MDFRDRLATFGPMRPEGATIDEKRMRMRFTLFVDCEQTDHPDATDRPEGRGYDREYELPVKFEVCSACHGKGSYVNPSIDAHGITASEMAEWDPEERQAYFDGAYDVSCQNCDGKRVEFVVDDDFAKCHDFKEAFEAYEAWCKAESAFRREREAEIRYGC